MKKNIFLLFISLVSLITLNARDRDNNIPDPVIKLKQQVISYYLAKKHLPGKENMQRLMKTLKEDGSWPDIDYTSKQRGEWPTCNHLVRTLDLAIAYQSPGIENKSEVLKAVKSSMNYWIKNDFICPNWWYPEIGVPKLLGPIMLLIQPSLSTVEFNAGVKILHRAKIGMTGQNRVWLSGNVIYHSILTGDTAMIRQASEAIQSEVKITDGEGIQADNSFHQHGPQQQFGNYGLAFAGDILQWAVMLDNTAYQFDDSKMGILRNYVLKGMRWVVWKNYFDVSACGRQLFPNSQAEKARSLASIYHEMASIDISYAADYQNALQNFTGNIHFWKSDMTIHRTPDFYASLKMCSSRVAGSESCNNENISGYHLGDAALLVYRRGDEYENIFPFWDWRKIPGITGVEDNQPLPVLTAKGYTIKSDFVGGVSDENNGMAGMYYVRDGIEACKSYFFFNDIIVCLGAGVSSELDKPVTTSVNQCLLKGNVLIHNNNKTSILSQGKHSINNAQWIVHDSIGYYFPQSGIVEMDNEEKSGSWNKVMGAMPDTKLKAGIFNLYIQHGNKPVNSSYAYYILPQAGEEKMMQRPNDIHIISNTKSLQCIQSMKDKMTGICFYEKGSLAIPGQPTITVDTPCMIMLAEKNGKKELNIADPTHLAKTIKVIISGKIVGKQLTGQFNSTTNTTVFEVSLPQLDEAGKTFAFDVQ